jgi:hypothetical protein
MFIYHGGWWLLLARPVRDGRSSWPIAHVIGAEGQVRHNFRLRALTVPVTFERPDSFSVESVRDRIARRRKRIELWEGEISDLQALQQLLEQTDNITPKEK